MRVLAIGLAAAALLTAQTLPAGPGKAVVQRVCTKCHGINAFVGMRMSREEWANEVETMISRGAVANARDRRAIVDYLTTHFGTK